MRYLGLDLGTKTLGISITDKTNTLVRPLKVLRFKSEDYESIVIFPNGTWKNEIAYYNANNNKITYFDEEITYTDEEIIAINTLVATKLQHSTTAIKKNYFKYLKEKYAEYGIENPIGLYLEENETE